MSSEEQDSGSDGDKTARTVGQLVKYSREVNQSDTVEEAGTYALEATVNLMDGHPSPTVLEVSQGDLRVVKSMIPKIESANEPSEVAKLAYETGDIVIIAGEDTEVTYEGDGVTVRSPDDIAGETVETAVTIAAPSIYKDEMGEIGIIVTARWPTLERVEEYHVKPLGYLADHVATAVTNIRSRERLERARHDLAKRKEMIEVYDSLLRHDLGNDLQIITGFSDALVSRPEPDEQFAEYAEKINETAKDATDLIDRIGNLMQTLEEESEPEPRDLRPIISNVVENVERKFDRLTVEFAPEDFEYQVFAGELLESIFNNVLSNAAIHNDGEVTVRVYLEGPGSDSIVVGFADDGTGVPEQVRDTVFEMGKRGPHSEGTGLGLGLARALLESYGGGIDLRESGAGGADFRVSLPRV